MPVVLLFSYSGVLGGAERVLIDFATALEGELVLACPAGTLADAAASAGLRVLPLRARPLELRGSLPDRAISAVHLAAHARESRRLVRDFDPDLVVACGMRSALALLLGPRPTVPVIFDHHDLLPGPAIRRLVRAAAAQADLVVVPSRAVARDLAVTGRLAVINPGIDVSSFESSCSPVDPPKVLLLGALVPWKRPDLALQTLALARRSHPDLRLRIVGSPLTGADERLVSDLRSQASVLGLDGAADFAGPVADVRPELARATCLLHCATEEPFGLALVEALASGRPVVAPAAGGPAEIVDSSCGFLYPPGDAAAAAAAVIELLSDPERAQRMGVQGRERVEALFDRSASAARFAAAAATVIRKRDRMDSGLAVLTVTHNSANALPGLLESVARHLPGTRVVVVDCASNDDSVAAAGSMGATVVALEANVGFGRACNRGMLEITEPVTALLNPDVELLDDSLLELSLEATRHDRLLAPLVLSPDGSRQDTVHPPPGSASELLGAILPHALPALAPWRSRSTRRVGWAVGCAIVARTETFRSLGPFDEGIFLYGEDLELGLHAAAEGIDTWFWPLGRVLHHRAHSTERKFGGEAFDRLARARRSVVGRRLGPRVALIDDVGQATTFMSRIAAKRLLGRSARRERQQLQALLQARQRGG